ncbi:RNA pseudouridine synthase 7 isoform X1 [Asparagus officinalis]|uniref:RNA pseudouridine synthase 7 isoform X1 n=1 Tax=Asparagus officinalis TaxID=4686 RepID=UPI00098E21E6|nr:RNA pseudouridine synthase 7 isoform X1 [Asparagus officinalis]
MEIVWESPANPPQAQDYIYRKGRRYVRPYYFEFISHAKNRWAGKTIVDLFAEEFKGRPYDYYVDAVKSGRIQVDGQTVHPSYVVQSSQKISHFLHRHEPPVLAEKITVLESEADVITVCKPASIPVHPCGQYRKNTIVGILQAEQGLAPLFPVHRLDRLVSGLLIFARNADKAESFRQQIEGGLLQKEYVAKVVGLFPEGEQVVNANVNFNAREGRSSVEIDEEFSRQPLKGKVACTKFMRISTNGKHSIVLCKPVTGRTHQIRVHLQYTGHPIGNDILYLSKDVVRRSTFGSGADRAASIYMDMPPQTPGSAANSDEFSIDPMCTNCPGLAPVGYDGDEEGLWLHCVRYTGPDWSYECPYPEWAFP